MTVLTALPRVVVRAAQQTDERTISPGVLGFFVTFAVVLACIPLFRSMTGKIRGVQYRAGLGAGDGSRGESGAGSGSDAGSNAGSGDDVAAPTVPDAGSAADDAPEGPGRPTPEA